MSNLKVCRICLRNNLKFYRFDQYCLKNYYEEIMSLPVSKNDGRPYYLCFECASLLHKFHLFRQKCYFSQNALTELIWSGQVNLNTVTKISKSPKLTTGSLGILTLNKKVNTYAIKQPSSEEDGTPLKEEVYVVNYSDISLSDDDTQSKDSETNDASYIPDINLDVDNFIDQGDSDYEEEKIEEPPKSKSKAKPKKKAPTKSKEVKSKVKKTKKKVVHKRKKQPITEEIDLESEDNSNAGFKDLNDYKFNQAKSGGLKVLKFLDSGFWKKSMLTEEEAMKEFHAKSQDRKYVRAAFKCTDCYRGFSKKNMLDRHIPLRHGESIGSLVCRFCKTRFKFAYHLNKHMRQHFTRYECQRCNLVCNLDKSALYHEEYHNGVIRKCPHCDQEFKHLSTFYTHLRTHRSKHMCSRCGESFVSQRGLYLHKKVKHIKDMESDVVDVDVSIYCEVCKINFETRAAYDIHLLHSAMHTDDKTNDDSSVRDIMKDDEDGEEKDEDDDVSEPSHLYSRKTRVEKTLSAIRKRALTKSSTKCAKKPTTCQHCGKHFETQKACRKHHHAEHPRKPFYTPKERVICEICGASLAPSSVPAHLNHHTHRKMYTCDTCGKSFTTNNVLRNHIATHTGERNHPCHICGKRFAQSGSLYLHYKTIHLKQPYPKRNRKKKVEEPTPEPAVATALNGKDEYRAWKHYFDNSTYSNS